MKIRLIFTLFLILTFNFSFSQIVTRQSIDSAFRKHDSTFNQKRSITYIINGVPYDSLQLDTAQIKFDFKSLIELRYLTCENRALLHCYNDLALLLFAYTQNSKVKRKNWKKLKEFQSDKTTILTLAIDNEPVPQGLVRQTIIGLRLKDIKYIDITDFSASHHIRIFKAKTL